LQFTLGASLDERRQLVQFMIDVSAEHSAKRPCCAGAKLNLRCGVSE
jgi:hypothetical protein